MNENLIAVSAEARNKYGVYDVDSALFLDNFSAPAGSRILVVGAHDEATANMLADCGFRVTGVDLRPYDKSLPECNYDFQKGDFCSFDNQHFLFSNWACYRIDGVTEIKSFDCFVALSCIEHFGMGAYGEKFTHRYYDVVAMRKAWELLKPGGVAYVSVPFGGWYLECWPHWRIYDMVSMRDRLANGFEIVKVLSASAGNLMIAGKMRQLGESLTEEEVKSYAGVPPSVSTLVVMRKVMQ